MFDAEHCLVLSQTLAFSATFTPTQLEKLGKMMRNPQVIRLTLYQSFAINQRPSLQFVRVRSPQDITTELINSNDSKSQWEERERKASPELWLRGVRQFYSIVSDFSSNNNAKDENGFMKVKIVRLARILAELAFNQCMVFCNDKYRSVNEIFMLCFFRTT